MLLRPSASPPSHQVVEAVDPVINVQWDDGGTPVPDTHYIITTGEFPEIELIAAHTDWRIWSYDPDNPGNIGDMGKIWTDSAGDFRIRVLTPSNGPGARDLNDIDLVPSGQATGRPSRALSG